MKTEHIQCIKFQESFYLGEVKQGKAEGQGMLTFNDEHYYCGGFSKNKFQGEGYFFFPHKGFIFGEFSEGKANGDIFWVNERMNYSKANLSDKSEGVKFVGNNPKGVSQANINQDFRSKVVSKIRQKIVRKDLGMLEKHTNLIKDESMSNEDIIQGASSGIKETRRGKNVRTTSNMRNLGAGNNLGSNITFLNKEMPRQKQITDVNNRKNIIKYLKYTCLNSRDLYPEKDKHNKANDVVSDMNKFKNTMQELEKINCFKKEHKYVRGLVLNQPGFNGSNSIGGTYYPWGTMHQGYFDDPNGKFYGKVHYMNGDSEWGNFRESSGQVQKKVVLDGFGSRYYRQKGIKVTGFFEDDKLNGNYLVDFIEKDTFKFCYFENDNLKKDYFYCDKPFDYKRMNKHLTVYHINDTTKEYSTSQVKIKKEIFDGLLQKTQGIGNLRSNIKRKSNVKKALEFKETQGNLVYSYYFYSNKC